MCASDLTAAILNFQLPVRLCSIRKSTIDMPDPENMGLAVGIVSRLQVELCVVEVLRPLF